MTATHTWIRPFLVSAGRLVKRFLINITAVMPQVLGGQRSPLGINGRGRVVVVVKPYAMFRTTCLMEAEAICIAQTTGVSCDMEPNMSLSANMLVSSLLRMK